MLNCRAFFNNGRLFRKLGLFAFSYFDGEKELGLSSFRRITLFLALIQEKLETKNEFKSYPDIPFSSDDDESVALMLYFRRNLCFFVLNKVYIKLIPF